MRKILLFWMRYYGQNNGVNTFILIWQYLPNISYTLIILKIFGLKCEKKNINAYIMVANKD